jgi:hypothetical protein
MTDKIDITIRLDKAKSDFKNLKRILNEMDNYEITATDGDEAIREVNDELRRRLIEVGLSK